MRAGYYPTAHHNCAGTYDASGDSAAALFGDGGSGGSSGGVLEGKVWSRGIHCAGRAIQRGGRLVRMLCMPRPPHDVTGQYPT